jgi:uncharacterized caspase-like protein
MRERNMTMRHARVVLCALVITISTLFVSHLSADDEIQFGRYHALVIGNDDYRHLPRLKTAVADAEAVAEVLRGQYGFDVELLRNASRADILRALNRYRAELTTDDNLLIYYAGHGWLDQETNTGFWQPVDAEEEDDLNWIANEDLSRRMNAMLARHVMVIADSCYSGTLVRSASKGLPTATEREAWLKRMTAKRSRTAIVSGGLEPVVDAGRGGHSVFANAFLTALKEASGAVAGQALFEKISRPVVVNADQTPQFSDIRRAGHEGGAFVFVPVAAEPPASTKAQAPAKSADKSMELAFWQAIQNSERAEDYEAYLQQFGNGTFAPLARSRLAALQKKTEAKAAPEAFSGLWVSEVLQNPFDKNDSFRLHFDIKIMGAAVLGTVTRKSSADSKRTYPATKRPLSEGKSEGKTITFQERFQVLFGSKTEDHARTFTGQIKGDRIDFFQQDSMGNSPVSFSATREKD